VFRLLTDFNDIDHDVVKGLIEDAEGPRALHVDDRVLLHDDGEHEAWGSVGVIADGLVSVLIDWDTWATAGTYRPQRRSGWWAVANFDLRPNTVGGGGVRMGPRRPVAGVG
jgi:hypothetical protein